ncbi:hypothetical protein RYX36_015266 [Vicia faba]
MTLTPSPILFELLLLSPMTPTIPAVTSKKTFPLQRFLQCQLKTGVIAWVSLLGLVVNVVLSWLLVYVWDFGLIGAAIALDVSWWVLVIGMFGYTVCGGCPLTWNGFSMEAFSGLWEFFKLSLASGVMLCLENWYYRILLLMTGQLENATVAVDALSVCMTINGWEMMIPFAFFAGTGVRVANELGAGKWKSAKFAMQVSLVQSTVIGLIFCILIVIFKREFAYIFTSSTHVLQTVNDMSILLGVSIVLNSVQPVLSAFCNAYGNGLTDWSLASTYGKLEIFTIGVWDGASQGGVLASLAACGVMMNIVSTTSDLMQDFKTGYLTLASPRSMFVSQIIGTTMG